MVDQRFRERAPANAVVYAVADAEDCEPEALPPLYETIDADALNALFESPPYGDAPHVAFEYCGYEVTVTGEGVEVDESP